MIVIAIHSGGQTGSDQGGLEAGRILGLRTGGWMPRGWRTERGPAPQVARLYGLKEHKSWEYSPRTVANVTETDGTLLFGDPRSPGTRLTAATAKILRKPSFTIQWHSSDEVPDSSAFLAWLHDKRVAVLNVAGNRESVQPGVGMAVQNFLVRALGNHEE